jgi:hypothetical protein
MLMSLARWVSCRGDWERILKKVGARSRHNDRWANVSAKKPWVVSGSIASQPHVSLRSKGGATQLLTRSIRYEKHAHAPLLTHPGSARDAQYPKETSLLD